MRRFSPREQQLLRQQLLMHFQHPNLLLSNTRRPLAGWSLGVAGLVSAINQLQADIAPRIAHLIASLGVFGNQTPPTANVSDPRFSRDAHFPRRTLGYMLMNVFVAPRGRSEEHTSEL